MREGLVPLKTPAVFEKETKSKIKKVSKKKTNKKIYKKIMKKRKEDKEALKVFSKSKEVQNNKEKVMSFVNMRSAYGELRY